MAGGEVRRHPGPAWMPDDGDAMPTHLLAGETVIITQRKHVAVLVPAGAVAVLCIGVLVFLIHLVPGRVLNHATGTVTAIADVVVVVVFLLWFLVRFLRWRMETYTLTTHRIVLSRGVISRVMESIALDRIQDMVVRRPFIERLIRSGVVEIDSAGRDGVEVLHLIPRPQRFYTAVLQAVEDYRRLGMGYPLPVEGQPAAAYPPPPLPPSRGGL
jgi:membrane protein YdbS with pleckstrin-like domain